MAEQLKADQFISMNDPSARETIAERPKKVGQEAAANAAIETTKNTENWLTKGATEFSLNIRFLVASMAKSERWSGGWKRSNKRSRMLRESKRKLEAKRANQKPTEVFLFQKKLKGKLDLAIQPMKDCRFQTFYRLDKALFGGHFWELYERTGKLFDIAYQDDLITSQAFRHSRRPLQG